MIKLKKRIFESLLKFDFGGALLLLPVGLGLGPGFLAEAGLVERLRAGEDPTEVEIEVLEKKRRH